MPISLVITGMHRSGTSLLANLAARGGVNLGADLLPGSRGNRHGHFEDREIVEFHERCLDRRDAGAFRPPAEGDAVWSPEEASAARAIVERRSEGGPWGWKDPRTSLFLPCWSSVLPDPLYLFVFRHPVEVALSLLRRGIDLDVQLDPRRAIRAWTAYNRRLLAFRRAYPERCLLWPLSAVVANVGAALGRLRERSGLPLPGRLETAYQPADLQLGLLAHDVDWSALLPEAMELYAELGRHADLPVDEQAAELGTGLSVRERELREAAETLLAVALGPSGEEDDGDSTSARQRVDYSQMKLLVAHQAEEIAVRERRLAELVKERERLASTRAWRLVHGYWEGRKRASLLGRKAVWQLRRLGKSAPPPPAEIVVGCVAENHPRFLTQALRLVRSLAWFGGSLTAARRMVCVVGGISPEDRQALEAEGAEVVIVERFDRRNPTANKLQLFAPALGSGARGVLLVDCDTIVVRDPWPLLQGGALQSKIVDVASVAHEDFLRAFRHYGLPLPRRRYRTTLLPERERTILHCNTGVVFLTAEVAREIVPAWREWNARVLDDLEVLGSSAHHVHQASLTLALAERPVPFVEASPALNFPLHMTHLPVVPGLLSTDPAILHYHDEVDADGCLLPTRYPLAQARIEEFNRRWRAEVHGTAPLLASPLIQPTPSQGGGTRPPGSAPHGFNPHPR